MQQTANQLKSPKESSLNDIKKLNAELEAARVKIKVRFLFISKILTYNNFLKSLQRDTKIKKQEIDGMIASLVTLMDKQMSGLQEAVRKQKSAEEQEKLRKIQEAMEAEKRRKAEEEAKIREEEENRRKRIEMEARRKAEDEERKRQEAENEKAAAAIQVNSNSHPITK